MSYRLSAWEDKVNAHGSGLSCMFAFMTIHQASQQLRFQLFHLYDEREANNIAALVMENITGWQKIDMVVNKRVPLSAKQQQQLERYTQALLANEPLQYVLQEAWFYGMRLYVDKNVLIPRPETEELVDWIIKDNSHAQPGISNRVVDIGTGSGCIPLAIKKKLPGFEVHAFDISEAALAVAEKNAANQQVNVALHHLDILAAAQWQLLPLFDIIVSNPPYIPEADKPSMAPNVLNFEPAMALFVADNDPLLFYRAIADFATTHLNEKGCIYLEIHAHMAKPVIQLYQEKGFAGIELRKDMQGKDRMIKVVAG